MYIITKTLQRKVSGKYGIGGFFGVIWTIQSQAIEKSLKHIIFFLTKKHVEEAEREIVGHTFPWPYIFHDCTQP